MRRTQCAIGLLGAIGLTAGAGWASAQESASATEEPTEVVVTGSRVISNGNESPTPVTVVQAEELMNLQPTTLADALNDLPVFSGSKSQNSNPIGTGIYGGGNPSTNILNLRNLGLTDTLVLVDGQRLSPTVLLGSVDVDQISDLLIQRVDVVTGGVSAVYGSDAVAGVVNYITDKKFNGVKFEAQAGLSTYGDDQSYKLGIAAGTSLFDGRLHVEGSVDRYTDAGILAESDRPDLAFRGVPGAGTASNPYTLLSDLRNNNSSFGGLITGGPLKGDTFNTDGTPTPFVHGTPTGTSTVEVGGDGSYSNPSLVAPEQMDHLFGRLDADITSTLHAHVQLMFSDKTDFQNGGGYSILGDTLSSTDAFLSPALQTALSAGGATTFTYSKVFPLSELAPIKSYAEEQQTQVFSGLDGKLGKFDWGLNLDYGRSTLYNTQYNNINIQNLSAALDAVINPANGQIVCHVTLTNPTADPGCAPLNPFGPSAASSAATRYISGNTHFTAVYELYETNGQISGELFNTWAGPVTAALSAEWRQLTFQSSSDAPPTLLQNCTGLPRNCTATINAWQNTFPASPLIRLTVTEEALEFNVPLLKDQFLAKAFNLNLAARAVSYSTSGDYYPFKIGPEWQITDDFRVRGTYSRDISAPTLYELYQPQSQVFQNQEDLLLGITYTVPSYNLGNPNLKSQVADTRTLGFVWQPHGTGFSISSDYYHITMENYIGQINSYMNQYQQACYSSGGTSPYCALIERPSYTSTAPTNRVTAWLTEFVNLSSLNTYGDDLEMNYTGRAYDHRFNLRILGSYQPHIIYTQANNDTYDLGGVASGPTPLTASPSLRLTGWASVSVTDQFTFGLAERWRNPMKMTGNETGIYAGNVFAPNHVASVGYTDVNLSYLFGPKNEIESYLNIANVFNTPPPPATFTINQNGPGPGYAAGDDPIGRYFILGLRAKF